MCSDFSTHFWSEDELSSSLLEKEKYFIQTVHQNWLRQVSKAAEFSLPSLPIPHTSLASRCKGNAVFLNPATHEIQRAAHLQQAQNKPISDIGQDAKQRKCNKPLFFFFSLLCLIFWCDYCKLYSTQIYQKLQPSQNGRSLSIKIDSFNKDILAKFWFSWI